MEGYEFLTLRENELMYLHYFRNQEDDIHPSFYESNKVCLSPWLHRDFLTPVVPAESLRQTFQLSQYIVKNEPLKDLFIIFAEAGSHLFEEEYSQSVLWAWIFIERWVSLKWEDYLFAQGASSKLSSALGVSDWQGWAREKGMSVGFRYWGEHESIKRLSLDHSFLPKRQCTVLRNYNQ